MPSQARLEAVSAQVHKAWMEGKTRKGITSRLSESGEELMVPYERLSEDAKDADRNTVLAVWAAEEALRQARD